MNDVTGLFILFCWATFVLYWLVSLFAVKRTIEKPARGGRSLLLVILLAAFAIGAFFSMESGSQLPNYLNAILLPQSLTLRLVADSITLCGLVVALWARTVLGSNWSGLVALKENHELVERGPYHYVRHPIYSGLLLMSLGTAIWFDRVIELVTFFVLLVLFWGKALAEEQLLTKHFPDAYPQYKKRVKALIPFLV